MPNIDRKTLVVIGAGPKGIATAIKAKVLEEFGLPVDRVILIEKNNVAAHWSGEHGYTNGEMKLGTSPEKDVVFPIEVDIADKTMNQRIKQRLLHFTWVSYLVQTDRYSDWVDRGRPAPCHWTWADYLRWVSAQLAPHVTIISAEVTQIDIRPSRDCWELRLQTADADTAFQTIEADRLMLTGPGNTRLDFVKNGTLPTGAYDLESFWSAIKQKTFAPTGQIAIIGSGENAASALLALNQYAPGLRVDIISPKGLVSTRAESFYENQVYSQPERNQWTELELKDRANFIERTDLGVFSVHAMTLLNEQIRHTVIPGRVIDLKTESSKLVLKIDYAQKQTDRSYDQVIVASGFDQIATLKKYLSKLARQHLENSLGTSLSQDTLIKKIQSDLSVSGLTPTLHLPMLAGLMQGPGFANLSCLGRLSDRIVTLATKEKWARDTRDTSFAQKLVLMETAL